MAYTKYSLTPANNTATPPDGAPEGMLPSAVNDTMRDMMAQIRDCGDGIRDGTYTMTAPKITGGTITGAAFTGNTFTSPVISGGSINNTPIGATTANTGRFSDLTDTGLTSGRVIYASTGGNLVDDADFTFNGTTVTMANDASISGLTVGKGANAVLGNTVLGNNALVSGSQSGTYGVAIGTNALAANTSGGNNVGVGTNALTSNTTGANNIAIGRDAAQTNTTGGSNVAIGGSALNSNTTASESTAVGYQSLYSNTTGTENVAVGFQSLRQTTTGTSNTAIGHQAAYSNTTGTTNIAMGRAALYSNTTGASNTALGYYALLSNTTASDNVAVGYQALYSTVTGNACTAVGTGALYSNTAAENSAFGRSALNANTTGTNNTALGQACLAGNTTGNYNAAGGRASLLSNTTGANNTAFGTDALRLNTTASNNTAVGYQALYSNTTGIQFVAFGTQAGYSNTSAGSNGCYIGYKAGYSATGSCNTFVGAANQNGNGCGQLVTTGTRNTILGGYDGNQGGLDIRTASNYIVLSDGDGNPRYYVAANGQYSQIGNVNGDVVGTITNTNASSPYGLSMVFNSAAPNNSSSFFYYGGDNTNARFVGMSNGGLKNYSANNVNLSDQSVKKDIQLAGNYLDKICAIPVKTFLYVDQSDTDLNLGVIAQDVQAVAPELTTEVDWGTKENPNIKLSVYESDLMFALMKSIQELKAEVDSLKAQLNK